MFWKESLCKHPDGKPFSKIDLFERWIRKQSKLRRAGKFRNQMSGSNGHLLPFSRHHLPQPLFNRSNRLQLVDSPIRLIQVIFHRNTVRESHYSVCLSSNSCNRQHNKVNQDHNPPSWIALNSKCKWTHYLRNLCNSHPSNSSNNKLS